MDSKRQRSRSSLIAKSLKVLLLLFFVSQAFLAARTDSVTVDEFAHLPLGLYMWRSADFSLDPINPPLSRMLLAAPLLGEKAELAASTDNVWALGYDFMQKNTQSYHFLFELSRCAVIFIALILVLLVERWASEVYGPSAGLCALALCCFCPNILAHSHLATTDLQGVLGFVLSLYLFQGALAKPSSKNIIYLSIALGLSILLKLSNLILLPLIFAGAIFAALRAKSGLKSAVVWSSSAFRLLRLSCLGLLVLLLVINLGYGFEGSFGAFKNFHFFEGGSLSSLQTRFQTLRLPLPQAFIEGIDRVLEEGKHSGGHSYLLGELSTSGFWYYHLIAFLAKTPIPTIFLSLLTVAFFFCPARFNSMQFCTLILPIIFVFSFNAFFNSQQIGLRHILPVYPLLYILIAPYLSGPIEKLIETRRLNGSALLSILALAWIAFGTARLSPRFLQYFNEAFGGAMQGHKVLVDSNLDWGQDLIRLKHFMSRGQIGSIKLAYFGRVDPGIYGISYTPLEKDSQGIGVISATFLMGRPYWWLKDGKLAWMEPDHYAWLRAKQPLARVGTFFIYNLDGHS